MITPKDKIGFIQRRRNETKDAFKLIVAKVQRVNIGKKKTSVYTKDIQQAQITYVLNYNLMPNLSAQEETELRLESLECYSPVHQDKYQTRT